MQDQPHGVDEDSDPASFRSDRIRELIQRYQTPLLAFANRLLRGDGEAAQDAVQETFLRLCKADLQKIVDHEAAWLFKVCRTRVIDMQRTKRVPPGGVKSETVVDPRQGPSAVAEAEDDRRHMIQLIDDLSPRQQEVLRLRLQSGLTYDEIAEVTGLQRSNVGFHLHQAVRGLRTAMQASQK